MAQRQHFASLDAIRGVAAISVMMFHLGHWLGVPGLAVNSGLAVDLFFCLSGYVLCIAYQSQIENGLSPVRFMRIRIIRLWPLIVLATLASTAFVLVRLLLKKQDVELGALLTSTLLGLLCLPFFKAPMEIGGPQVFPLNGPQYTLFLELGVNLFWALSNKFVSFWIMVLLTAISLLAVSFFGLGGDETATFWMGVPRVLASYFLGVLVFHGRYLLKGSASQAIIFTVSVVLMLCLFYFPSPLPLWADLLWIAVLSPVLVVTGAHAKMPTQLNGVALLLGRLSYPIYALHYPIFCWVNGTFQTIMKRRDVLVEIPISVLATIAISYMALVIFDEPVRKVLSKSRIVTKSLVKTKSA